jgi:hypothetical protein
VSSRLDPLDIPCWRWTMSGLLTGVAMSWRGDGEQGMQWSLLKRSLNQGLSPSYPFFLPQPQPKQHRKCLCPQTWPWERTKDVISKQTQSMSSSWFMHMQTPGKREGSWLGKDPLIHQKEILPLLEVIEWPKKVAVIHWWASNWPGW